MVRRKLATNMILEQSGNMMMVIQVLHSRLKNIKQLKQPQHICLIAIGVRMSMIEKLLFEELRIQKKPWKMH